MADQKRHFYDMDFAGAGFREMLEKQKIMEASLSQAGIVLLDWDSESGAVYATIGFERYELSTLIGDDLLSEHALHTCFHPDDYLQAKELMNRIIRGGARITMKLRMLMTDGQYRLNQVMVYSVPGKGGQPKTLHCIFRDIQEEWERMIALKFHDLCLNEVITNIADGLFVFRWDGRSSDVFYMTRNACRYFGMSYEDYETYIDISNIEHKIPCMSILDHEQYKKLVEIGEIEVRVNSAQGKQTQLLIRCYRDEAFPENYYGALIYNITERGEAFDEIDSTSLFTGLPRRRKFEKEMLRSKWLDSPIRCVAFIGIRDADALRRRMSMKEFDKILRQMGDIIEDWVDKDSFAARFSGEKFVVFYTGENADTTRQRGRAVYMKMRMLAADHADLQLRFGVAFAMQGQEYQSNEQIYEAAYRALLDAEKDEANDIAFRDSRGNSQWEPEMPSGVQRFGRNRRKMVFIRTFGYFTVFVDGRPIAFRNKKAQELLALLVDRRGGFVTAGEAISVLWENEPVNEVTRSRYRKVYYRLKRELEEKGVEDILITEDRMRRLDRSKVICDMYELLENNKEYVQTFAGDYMLDYSWAETTAAELAGIWKFQ